MNKSSEIIIEFCAPSDIGKVQAFLHDHWAQNHILAVDRTLMDWQHADNTQNRYSFVIARVPGEDDLCGILGFISTRQYDPALTGQNTLWLTTWMARPDMRKSALGIKLLRFLTDNEPAAAIGTVGNNEDVSGVYAALRYKVGTLNRHAIINPSLSTYRLLSGTPEPSAKRSTTSASLKCLTREDLASPEINALIAGITPAKTATYIANRYLNHPAYSYDILGLIENDKPQAVAITRTCAAEGGAALRVVDYFGPDNAVPSLSRALRVYVEEQRHEYADFYSYGLSEEAFERSIFRLIPADGALVLPNYFEPLDRQNTIIRFALKTDAPAFRLFKADADQDRPNQLTHASSNINVSQSA